MIAACADCLRRTELIAWLAGRIEHEWRLRRGRPLLLALTDEQLLDWGADGDVRARYASFAPAFACDRLTAAGLSAVCRCSPHYPDGLRELADPPAVLHAAGDLGLIDGSGAALVGARNPSPYGRDVAAEDHPNPKDWIAALIAQAETLGRKLDWINCGLCVDERGVAEAIAGTRVRMVSYAGR